MDQYIFLYLMCNYFVFFFICFSHLSLTSRCILRFGWGFLNGIILLFSFTGMCCTILVKSTWWIDFFSFILILQFLVQNIILSSLNVLQSFLRLRYTLRRPQMFWVLDHHILFLFDFEHIVCPRMDRSCFIFQIYKVCRSIILKLFESYILWFHKQAKKTVGTATKQKFHFFLLF